MGVEYPPHTPRAPGPSTPTNSCEVSVLASLKTQRSPSDGTHVLIEIVSGNSGLHESEGKRPRQKPVVVGGEMVAQ